MRTLPALPLLKPSVRLGCIALAASLGLSLAVARAQGAAPASPDLRTLRVDYRKGLLEALLPHKKSYRDELDALEKRLAAEADFSGAIRARDEKNQLDQEIMAMEQEIPALNSQSTNLHSAALPDKIVLSPAEARLTGLTLDPKDKTIRGWKVSRSLATWSVPPLPPGGYEVRVVWSSPANGSATFMVREVHYTLQFKATELTTKPREQLLGTLKVQAGTTAISLSAEKLEGDLPVRIHSVTLVPANR